MSLTLSLAQWSLHRAIFSGQLDPMDFPRVARRDFGIAAVELVSQLLPRLRPEIVRELRKRADGEGVKIQLVMVDDEGDLSHPRVRIRQRAIRRHRAWIDAAAAWGAQAIRVNSGGEKHFLRPVGNFPPHSPQLLDPIERCAESCAALADQGRAQGVAILLENHGGLSSNAWALTEVVRLAGRSNVGLLPDFGNFQPGVDRYSAVATMIPWARALSAKTYDFDDAGQECTFDFPRLMQLVVAAGYSGPVGIEYEGTRLGEAEGIRRSKQLLAPWVTAG